MLENAIQQVKNNYCVWEYNQKPQRGKRVFAYELYHQFKTLIKNDLKIGNLRFDGEIDKNLNIDVEYCGVDRNLLRIGDDKFFNKQRSFSPDLVLHLGQNDSSEDDQSLLIEIKTKQISDSKLAKDLVKFNHYIWRLNFQYAVFISVNTNFDVLKQQIRNIFLNQAGWNERFDQIVIFNYNNETLQANTLQNVLEE